MRIESKYMLLQGVRPENGNSQKKRKKVTRLRFTLLPK